MSSRILVKKMALPTVGIGIDEMPDADYGDAFGCSLGSDVGLSPDEVALGLLKSRPWWFRMLLRIRGILVKPFGLRGENRQVAEGRSESAGEPPAVPVNSDKLHPIGSKMAFFKVEQRTVTDLLLANEDKHLRALLWITVHAQEVSVITLVKFKNRFGRVYMFLIGPFHKLIVARLLRMSLERLLHDRVPKPTSALGSD